MKHSEHGPIRDNKGLLCVGAACVGDIIEFQGKFFDPNGAIEGITAEQAQRHNDTLDAARILGLDQNCEVGMHGLFYFTDGTVKTWRGTVVSDRVQTNGRNVTFWRKGMQFQGRRRKDEDCVDFKRVA